MSTPSYKVQVLTREHSSMSPHCPSPINYYDIGVFTILLMSFLSNEVWLSCRSYDQEIIYYHQTRWHITYLLSESSDEVGKGTTLIGALRKEVKRARLRDGRHAPHQTEVKRNQFWMNAPPSKNQYHLTTPEWYLARLCKDTRCGQWL